MRSKRGVPLSDLFLLKMNPLLRFFIMADVVAYAGAGMLAPIFALFIDGFIEGGSAEVAGVAAAIFLFTKSAAQIPAAAIIDKICGERDDFWVLFIGMIVASLVPLSYLFISTPLELYITQFVLGLSLAATFPSFMALFTRHMEPGREATVWGVYYMLIDFSAAAAGAIGGVVAATVGFEAVILGVTAIGLMGALLYLPAEIHLRRGDC